jgi:hypothetical protein
MQAHARRRCAKRLCGMLTEQLRTLTMLELELKLERPVQDIRERLRLDDVSAAIARVQECLDKLVLVVG